MVSEPQTNIRVVIATRATWRPRLREAFTAAGIVVAAECDDVTELLAAVSREHPDACVVERELRGGGLSAAAAITSPRRAPRVLMLGGRGSLAERRAARIAGASDCLSADFDAGRVVKVVHELVSPNHLLLESDR
jgi:ActR/RegA family two-component response regulator